MLLFWNKDSEQIKIGNIRITTSSIELINNSNVVQNVVEGTFTGGDIAAVISSVSGTISGSEQIIKFISSSEEKLH